MKHHELTTGRTFGVTFDHGEDFFDALGEFCQAAQIRQGYIPMFLAGFADAEIVGTCGRLTEPDRPLWDRVHVEHVEALGCGTIAWDPDAGTIRPHVHTTLGLKAHSATAHTSHLLRARVQFLTELLVVEVTSPQFRRLPNPTLHDVPLLRFDTP